MGAVFYGGALETPDCIPVLADDDNLSTDLGNTTN